MGNREERAKGEVKQLGKISSETTVINKRIGNGKLQYSFFTFQIIPLFGTSS